MEEPAVRLMYDDGDASKVHRNSDNSSFVDVMMRLLPISGHMTTADAVQQKLKAELSVEYLCIAIADEDRKGGIGTGQSRAVDIGVARLNSLLIS